ncbi:hypothetical protein GPECTOR_2g1384 [Gonium pectorale]|uniref:F-box domain-containing protein n=1 Tax=Gonium pectorale TaxID=33097 RepID=A0A150H1E7_GONPE|nr:hypothetical protein GPECTOR_2g1384 [Gonium pectorale]|eukprot:KXZ55833.1 hypothetical protein GPECTOR_2g1384 [Gonium pectorale]
MEPTEGGDRGGSKRSAHIENFPIEIIRRVADFARPQDVGALRASCRRLRCALDETRTHVTINFAQPYRSSFLSVFDQWPLLREVYVVGELPESCVSRMVQDAVAAGRLPQLRSLLLTMTRWGEPAVRTAVVALFICEAANLGAMQDEEAVAELESLDLPKTRHLFERRASHHATHGLSSWLVHYGSALSYAGSHDLALRVAALIWVPEYTETVRGVVAAVRLARGQLHALHAEAVPPRLRPEQLARRLEGALQAGPRGEGQSL